MATQPTPAALPVGVGSPSLPRCSTVGGDALGDQLKPCPFITRNDRSLTSSPSISVESPIDSHPMFTPNIVRGTAGPGVDTSTRTRTSPPDEDDDPDDDVDDDK